MPEFIGQGLGKYFLRWAIDKAWSYGPRRFWLHTDTKDHPGALPNYLKAGLVEQALDRSSGLGAIPAAERLYQFKITLLDTRPPVWRRIQVRDCTLDKLHEHIQTAMGWTNSHLHHFWIDGQFYADDPMLMRDNFKEMAYKDSTRTKLSDILPKSDRRFC